MPGKVLVITTLFLLSLSLSGLVEAAAQERAPRRDLLEDRYGSGTRFTPAGTVNARDRVTKRRSPRRAGPVVVGPTPKKVVNQCFWHEPSGGPFGSSGFCSYPSYHAVGSPCVCWSTFQKGGATSYKRLAGTVVAAPAPGRLPPVR